MTHISLEYHGFSHFLLHIVSTATALPRLEKVGEEDNEARAKSLSSSVDQLT
jgi:hypothetical protein